MDKVNLTALERLDLEDFEGVQALSYEHTRRLMGQLLGAPQLDSDTGAGGLLSAPLITHDSNAQTLSFGSFAYLELTRGGAELDGGRTSTPEARIIRFNAADTDHPAHPVDISAHSSAGSTYAISARYVEVIRDIETRRRWDSALSAEVTFSPPTRRRERVELRAHLDSEELTNDTSAPARWVKLLRFSFFPISGALSVEHIHALDSAPRVADEAGIEPERLELSSALDSLTSEAGQSRTLGLIEHLAQIRRALFRVIDRGELDTEAEPEAGARWDTPRRSLRSLSHELQTLTLTAEATDTTATANTSELNTQSGRLDALEATKRLIIHAHLELNYDGGHARVYLRAHNPDQIPLSSITFDHSAHTSSGRFAYPEADIEGAYFSDLADAIELFKRPVFTFNSTGTPPLITSLNAYPLTYPNDIISAAPPKLTFRRAFSADPFSVQPDEYPTNGMSAAPYFFTTETGATSTARAVALLVDFEAGSFVSGTHYLTLSYELTLDTRGAQ